MTFEEIQQTLEKMLAVQRELQESQIRESQEISELKQTTADQKDSIERLLRLSISHIEGHLDNRGAIENLARRIESLENR